MSESSKTRLQKKFDDIIQHLRERGVIVPELIKIQKECEDLELTSLYSAIKGDFPLIGEAEQQWSMFSTEQSEEVGTPAFWCNSWENGLPKLTDEMRKQIKNDLGMD